MNDFNLYNGVLIIFIMLMLIYQFLRLGEHCIYMTKCCQMFYTLVYTLHILCFYHMFNLYKYVNMF